MANILKPGKSLRVLKGLFGGRNAPKATAAQSAKFAASRGPKTSMSNDGPAVRKGQFAGAKKKPDVRTPSVIKKKAVVKKPGRG